MKKFDEEFKANAVRLVREERMKIKDVAHDLGIGKSTLSYWLGLNRKGELIKTASQKKEDEDMRKLRKENRILKEERDILKKAMGIFSTMSKADTEL
ncbi:transposase [Candidatus Neptunichlamydia sp. REUL1]|uniref:transposase n=1 Tax=Candidatus Neptunichlamydia sp. REUL1 TaxID=3064277 RepID=UPI002931F1C0|nr:transposase [Candidatus Neptunochlamydia sp. REUL1]